MKLFILLIVIISGLLIWFNCFGEEIGIASWYSTKESKGVMANGEPFDDTVFTCASWSYPFGTILVVRNIGVNGQNKSTKAKVTDRGPGQPKCLCLQKPQRIIDLSKASFKKLAPLSEGLIPVRVEQID